MSILCVLLFWPLYYREFQQHEVMGFLSISKLNVVIVPTLRSTVSIVGEHVDLDFKIYINIEQVIKHRDYDRNIYRWITVQLSIYKEYNF